MQIDKCFIISPRVTVQSRTQAMMVKYHGNSNFFFFLMLTSWLLIEVVGRDWDVSGRSGMNTGNYRYEKHELKKKQKERAQSFFFYLRVFYLQDLCMGLSPLLILSFFKLNQLWICKCDSIILFSYSCRLDKKYIISVFHGSELACSTLV